MSRCVFAALLASACSREPQAPVTAPDSFTVAIETNKGTLTFAIHRAWAPNGADRFYALVGDRFFDDGRFFRVVPNFVAQFGLPARPAQLRGLAEQPMPDEPVRQSNLLGTLAFASAGPNTRSSQLFINLRDNTPLDVAAGGYPPIGRLVAGGEVLGTLNGEYGSTPDQDSIRLRGNRYLERSFPRLDYIRTARIVREWR